MPHASTCPVCGSSNHCALIEGQANPCWCFSVKVAEETLASLPESQRGQACLCPGCAAGLSPTSGQALDPSRED
ncbi:cysteine-rich CWC family protein [Pseudomonas massiliensis]|uniref:cysteine-rich CWC family protein n=1 Tax=Pseudomonas massiliensis TaxID=522492 RepID=UPI000A0769C6|nr:cysteine-rich CWC family protein [Pseudomonas massiliensis]